jgi:GT2 family glycosyltransferase
MNLVMRKAAFESIGGFNESLVTCEDVDLCYRLNRDFKIISDVAVRAVHFGEAKTVGDFFRKERWRGQSNLAGIRSHGFHWRELPSLLLPAYYLVAVSSIPISLALLAKGAVVPMGLSLSAILVPPLLMSLRTARRSGSYRRLPGLSLLYLVYSLARASSLVSTTQLARRKDTGG